MNLHHDLSGPLLTGTSTVWSIFIIRSNEDKIPQVTPLYPHGEISSSVRRGAAVQTGSALPTAEGASSHRLTGHCTSSSGNCPHRDLFRLNKPQPEVTSTAFRGKTDHFPVTFQGLPKYVRLTPLLIAFRATASIPTQAQRCHTCQLPAAKASWRKKGCQCSFHTGSSSDPFTEATPSSPCTFAS